ncbi:HU family DNA-binding protein [Spiroplasma endosymbiont of Virgichneumon dumeticola]|uniref:HU family DNA-binding protein n=2 Tax=unclassified Spiroplasma TaxID=2637901 RepID=UPI0035C8890D
MMIGYEERVEIFMQKKQIIKVVQKELQSSEADYKDALETMFEKIILTLERGEDVTIRNFGTFTIKTRKARRGVNPKTGESIMIDKQRVVKFNSCKKLKQLVNGKGKK